MAVQVPSMGHRPLVLAAVLVSFLVAAAWAPRATAAISCGQVAKYMGPCTSYVVKGGSVPSNCCSGIKALNGAAKTSSDRQAACSCLKSISGRINGLKPTFAARLPRSCGVSIPYTISPTIDCSKVH